MEKLYVIYGNKGEEMARAIMERMNIARDLEAIKKENPLIRFKPNLVVAQPAQWGATTDPGDEPPVPAVTLANDSSGSASCFAGKII
jgi:hypothetical protein